MHGKDLIAHSLLLTFRRTPRRGVVIGAVGTALVLFLGGCEGSDSPPGTYHPAPGGSSYRVPSGPGWGNSGPGGGRFTPAPPQGPYSPGNLNSPYTGCQSPYTPGC